MSATKREMVRRSPRPWCSLELRGFGGFKVRQHRSRTARNPKVGTAVYVPAKKVPRLQGPLETAGSTPPLPSGHECATRHGRFALVWGSWRIEASSPKRRPPNIDQNTLVAPTGFEPRVHGPLRAPLGAAFALPNVLRSEVVSETCAAAPDQEPGGQHQTVQGWPARELTW